MHTHAYIYTHMHVYMCASVCVYTYTNTRGGACVYTHMRTHARADTRPAAPTCLHSGLQTDRSTLARTHARGYVDAHS